jgi:hypothetical protein
MKKILPIAMLVLILLVVPILSYGLSVPGSPRDRDIRKISGQGEFEDLIVKHTTSGKPLNIYGSTIVLTDTLDIPVGVFSFNGSGLTLDASNLTSGYAVRFVPSASQDNNAVYEINGLTVIGPDSDSSTLDGVFIGRDTDGNTAGVVFRNIEISGFRDNLYLDTYTWRNQFHNLVSHDFHRYGINAQLGTSAGEDISFFGGSIYNGTNASHDSTAFYAPYPGNADMYFYGTAFDYNDIDLELEQGNFLFSGCHFEDSNAYPFGLFSNDTGSKLTVFFEGGMFTAGTTKAVWINSDDDNIYCTFNGTHFYTYGNADDSELVQVDSGYPVYRWNNVSLIADPGESPRLSAYFNQIGNPGLETGDTTYWTINNSANVTHSIDAVTYYAGADALKATGTTGAANGSATQAIDIGDKQSVLFSAWVKSNLTDGYGSVLIKFYSRDETLISTKEFSAQRVSGVTDWTRVCGYFRVPPNAHFASLQLYSYATIGDLWFDDIEVWLY